MYRNEVLCIIKKEENVHILNSAKWLTAAFSVDFIRKFPPTIFAGFGMNELDPNCLKDQ
jgi:hypothetical protein